jgi:hypothetical protein
VVEWYRYLVREAYTLIYFLSRGAAPLRQVNTHPSLSKVGECEGDRDRSALARQGAAGGGTFFQELEARVRIELTYKGFADLSLTTWVPRPADTN